jgi:transposase
MKCPRCNGTRFWTLSSGQQRCAQCRLTRKFKRSYWQATRIPPYWKGRLVEYFCLGVPAHRLRHQVPFDRKTVQRWFGILREVVYRHQVLEWQRLSRHTEPDGTASCSARPGSMAWETDDPCVVFGIFHRNGAVWAVPAGDQSVGTTVPLIRETEGAGCLFYADDRHAYTFLAIRGNHVVVRKRKDRAGSEDAGSEIEGFWSHAKRWLRHYRGVPKSHFHLYLKEIEWRFNHRNENLVKLLRKHLNQPMATEEA